MATLKHLIEGSSRVIIGSRLGDESIKGIWLGEATIGGRFYFGIEMTEPGRVRAVMLPADSIQTIIVTEEEVFEGE